jgi:hypothetical protein
LDTYYWKTAWMLAIFNSAPGAFPACMLSLPQHQGSAQNACYLYHTLTRCVHRNVLSWPHLHQRRAQDACYLDHKPAPRACTGCMLSWPQTCTRGLHRVLAILTTPAPDACTGCLLSRPHLCQRRVQDACYLYNTWTSRVHRTYALISSLWPMTSFLEEPNLMRYTRNI